MTARPYRPNGGFAPTFKALRLRNDAAAVRSIAGEASILYSGFMKRHKDLNAITGMHYRLCCERAALYLTIKKYYPKSAMRLIDLSVKSSCEKVGRSINRSLRLPFFRDNFFSVMMFAAMKVFGAGGGFKSREVSKTRDEARFDVLECPYCKFLTELGCFELTANFCKSDEYTYGDLDGIAFERTQSLGTGGTKCDFCMKRK